MTLRSVLYHVIEGLVLVATLVALGYAILVYGPPA